MPDDEKYIVFRRDEFLFSQLNDSPVPPPIHDAVVIRRQDKFASPALATYAAMIAIVASEHPDPKVRSELLTTADYFEGQAQLAAEEGFKLPDR